MIPLTIGAFLLEKRQYDENATPEEVEAIKSRVYILEEGIVFYKEVPVISVFSAKVMLTKVLQLVEEQNVKAMLVDLELAKPPSFQVRNVIFENLAPIMPKLEICCFSSGKNKLLNVAIQFFLNGAKFPGSKIRIIKTKEESLQLIHERLKR